MIDLTEQVKCTRYLPPPFVEWLEKKLGLHALNLAHERIESDWEAGSRENFFRLACRHLTLDYKLEGEENIPREGACVIVSNHPHGMSDGIMFGDVAMKVRQDIRIVVNEFLHCVRGMRPYEITVDVYGGEAAKRANIAGMREILRWLKAGHCILVFPSGSAATYSPQDKRIIDDPWQENIAAIIRKTGATVVPMFISGHSGKLFQAVSRISRSYRANLLPREILRDMRTLHSISLGPAIAPATLAHRTDAETSDYLRLRTMLLRYREHAPDEHGEPAQEGRIAPQLPPIDDRAEAAALRAEIDALPPECLCYGTESSPLAVYATDAEKIPHLLHRIGYERERTFRAVGEGTGTACDLDRWDQHYVHLVMWDREANCLAGAYRIGHTDLLLQKFGKQGIYNASFFRFSARAMNILSRGLEMGRAFITPEYQRKAASLDTLWMGIGRYLNMHPRYCYLYGTVSISRNYSFAARSLILSFLRRKCMNLRLAGEVQAKFPPQRLGLLSEDERLLDRALPDARDLSALVAETENDGNGIPILLKQYLRLGGRMVSFGIDNDFGGVLDCLVVVDLSETPERICRRYRGRNYCAATPPEA